MSELNYKRSDQGGGTPSYSSQQAPFRRNRADAERWAQVVADNAVLARKLRDIGREPPASYHAPRGYQSVRGGKQIKQARTGKPQNGMPETPHYMPPTAWPPLEPAHEIVRQPKAQRELTACNAHLAAKLREVYRKHHVGHSPGDERAGIANPGSGNSSCSSGGKAAQGKMDCNERWALRTALYDSALGAAVGDAAVGTVGATAAAAAAAAAAGSFMAGGRTLDLEQASVPKSLGVALCGGCGARCFYAADGVRLMRCRGCKAAWYCSEACARLDYQSHKAVCKHSSTGHWTPGGIRPAEDCWVSNAAMAEVRQELRRRAAALAAAGAAGAASLAVAAAVARVGGPGCCAAAAADDNDASYKPMGSCSYPGSAPSPQQQQQRSSQRQQQQQQPGLPHQRRRQQLTPRPAGSPCGGRSSSAQPQRRSVTGNVTGVPALEEGELEDEADVLFSLESKYRELRNRELQAERKLQEVEFRANHGLDGPRPCMFSMKRFAAAASTGKGGSRGGDGARRPASAGPQE
ncbi:hypothetical protein Agub_g11487, partial [Astrephomene gubernaculifera]